MEHNIIGPVKRTIRIWLPDEMENDGGIWINATVHDVIILYCFHPCCIAFVNTTTYTDIIIEENQKGIDLENNLSSFEGYKIENI